MGKWATIILICATGGLNQGAVSKVFFQYWSYFDQYKSISINNITVSPVINKYRYFRILKKNPNQSITIGIFLRSINKC